MLRKTMCLLFFVTLLSGCISESGTHTSSQAENESRTGESETVRNDEFTEGEIMENAPVQDETGMPYMHRDIEIIYDGYPLTIGKPWDIYNFLDSVKLLTVNDMKGSHTFFNGDVYSFVRKDGNSGQPATLPIGDEDTEIAHLYMSKTKSTESLKAGDVIALEGVLNQPDGIIQKVVKIEITRDIIHLATIAPRPDEMWGTPRMKK